MESLGAPLSAAELAVADRFLKKMPRLIRALEAWRDSKHRIVPGRSRRVIEEELLYAYEAFDLEDDT